MLDHARSRAQKSVQPCLLERSIKTQRALLPQFFRVEAEKPFLKPKHPFDARLSPHVYI